MPRINKTHPQIRVTCPGIPESNGHVSRGTATLTGWWQPLPGYQGRIVPNLANDRQPINNVWAYGAGSKTDPRCSAILGSDTGFAPGPHPDIPAFNFTGSSNSYVEIPFTGHSDLLSDETWMFWVYHHNDGSGWAPGSSHGAYIKVGLGTYGWALGIGGTYLEDSGNQILFLREDLAWHYSGANEPAGWTHYVIHSGSSGWCTIFRNGERWWEIPSAAYGPEQTATRIGGYGTTRHFTGRIADFRYYDKLLQEAEIREIYRASKAGNWPMKFRRVNQPIRFSAESETPAAGITYSQLERSQRGFNRGLWTGK